MLFLGSQKFSLRKVHDFRLIKIELPAKLRLIFPLQLLSLFFSLSQQQGLP